MNAEQAIMKEIMIEFMASDCDNEWSYVLTDENVYEAYEDFSEKDLHGDGEDEFRCSGEVTSIRNDGSRHFEADSVARKLLNGQWVGWTYYYGGGKHAEPSAMDWMDDAYFLSVEEKEVTITRREFTKID